MRSLPLVWAAKPNDIRGPSEGRDEDDDEEAIEVDDDTRYILDCFMASYYPTETGLLPYAHLNPNELSARLWRAFQLCRVLINDSIGTQRRNALRAAQRAAENPSMLD